MLVNSAGTFLWHFTQHTETEVQRLCSTCARQRIRHVPTEATVAMRKKDSCSRLKGWRIIEGAVRLWVDYAYRKHFSVSYSITHTQPTDRAILHVDKWQTHPRRNS